MDVTLSTRFAGVATVASARALVVNSRVSLPQDRLQAKGGQLTERRLTENQVELLLQFDADIRWLRPLDLGGRDGSNHSAVLAQLVGRGLVESKMRSPGVRGSKLYRITPAGLTAAAAVAEH